MIVTARRSIEAFKEQFLYDTSTEIGSFEFIQSSAENLEFLGDETVNLIIAGPYQPSAYPSCFKRMN
jgi:dsRNA-specific ribonuclease